ncbi:MAG: DUF4974 domain-containing protein [Bacteroidetes bacterium]|nr:DUF4974 domain-containing protein [Bacteroidota bacterium]
MPRLNDLLDKYVLGTCSKDEFEELMQLLKAEDNEEAVRGYMQKMYKSLDSEVISDLHIDEQGGMFQSGGEVGVGRRIFWKRALAVAAVVSVVFAGLYYFTRPGGGGKAEDAKTISRIYTPAGSKTSVVLPDGTEVWLNSLSTLTYSTAEFNSGRREVSLVGEAMFRVRHDSLHLFVVHTKNFDVKDLGTVFNVSAYPEDLNGQASLISGSIEVITKGGHSRKLTLVPNQRIIIQNDKKVGATASRTDTMAVEPKIRPILLNPQVSIAPDTAWMVNKLIFMDETFYDLATQMQRRYGVVIVFRNEKARNYKFAGRFEEENIDEALKELQAIAPFAYRREGNQIYIE